MAVNETSEGQYEVKYRNVDNGKVFINYYNHELQAVQAIGQVELYANLKLISYSDNIDRSKYRR